MEVVDSLNNQMEKKKSAYAPPFLCVSGGKNISIEIDGHHMWSLLADDREEDEKTGEYEPLEPFIKRKFNKYVDGLANLKFDI